MKKKVVIIGAGVAGLSAGCYLQMNGYDSQIFELHSLPGGLCTAWQRKGYTIDGCIHWLVGSNPNAGHYTLWNELMDMKNISFFNHPEYFRIHDKDGKCIRLFTDISKLEKEMLDNAPEDKDVILEFTNAARKFSKLDFPVGKAPELYNLFDKAKFIFKFLPYMKDFKKWSNISIRDFAQRCKNPFLKEAFMHLFLPDMMALFAVFTIAWMDKKVAGYPIGGSLEFARRIEKRYLELGGKINYQSKVKKIRVENIGATNVAKGIELENGRTENADVVISAADGHATLFDMLEGKFIDNKVKQAYEHYQVFPSYLQISLGLNRTFENLPSVVCYCLDKPIIVDDQTSRNAVGFRIFNFDPTLAPQDKTVITSLLVTANYQYWENLKQNDMAKYNAEKYRLADQLVEVLEKKIGDIKKHVEMIDVSTPATVARYTNNWKGSLEGWVLAPGMKMGGMSKTLCGLENFYMIGQWVEAGGGVPPSAQSGRNVTQVICKKDKKEFVTVSY